MLRDQAATGALAGQERRLPAAWISGRARPRSHCWRGPGVMAASMVRVAREADTDAPWRVGKVASGEMFLDWWVARSYDFETAVRAHVGLNRGPHPLCRATRRLQ